jgi:hypothetical protein
MYKIASLIIFLCVLTPMHAYAHQPRFVAPAQHDVMQVEDVRTSQAFYGELAKSPHLYEFTLTEPTSFFAEILVPDIDSAKNDKSGLLLKVEERGVTEVVRMNATEASWESFYEWFGGDWYRRGASYYDSLESGTYQLEVSTPVNRGKYVLVVGKEERFDSGYIATLHDIREIKFFFEKPSTAVMQSPFVYVPVIFLLILGYILWRVYRKRVSIS